MTFLNVYEDADRAESYAKLEFPGTYYLAYRDIPLLIEAHVKGDSALDFGCGTGRSTRFLRDLGFHVLGIDISANMIIHAKSMDPDGDYRWVDDGDLGDIPKDAFDLILSVFTFDNIPTNQHKLHLLEKLKEKLRINGKLINLVSSPDIYLNEWASFTTKDFPENRKARDGDKVKIIMTDVADRRPVEDILCTDEQYQFIFKQAGLSIIDVHRPMGKTDEPFEWKSETRISPWCIYILSAIA
jgi:SAM-dependent methyltransferase